MDVMVKMARFQIKQNVLNLKSTLSDIHHYHILGQLDPSKFRIIENDPVKEIIQTSRLGIPKGRDEHLEYRKVYFFHAAVYCSSSLKVEKIIIKIFFLKKQNIPKNLIHNLITDPA